MVSFQPILDALLKALPPHPVPQHLFDELVTTVLEDTKDGGSAETRKSQWEYLLRKEVFDLAATEGQALKETETEYYNQLQGRLDLILTFTEHDACEQTVPFNILQDLLETQTIASCSHIFSWIESRSPRLTVGMVPQKGKALILLRTLNDLLRRLSKMGNTTIFCGRILTFLSGVFPLGERSGVNLRGEFGSTWENVRALEAAKTGKEEQKEVGMEESKREVEDVKMDVVPAEQQQQPQQSQADSRPIDKDEFYNTFWSLQLPFSKPTVFINPPTFNEFKEEVDRVLPVIKEATAKERAMMGSRSAHSSSGPLKRKRDQDSEDDAHSNLNEYFFAKFLTSPDLLDLEVADTHFRRQFLFQLLILLNHLLTFTKTAKQTWMTTRNRSLHMDFTLEPDNAQWVQETISKAAEELKQTTPNGRAFADTVTTILDREKNWVRWKNELCAPFDKEPWSETIGGQKVGMFEATAAQRTKMQEWPEEWKFSLGSEPLTEIWEMGYQRLEDLENTFHPGEVKDFVKKTKQENFRIEQRKKQLAKVAERMAPKPVPTPPPPAAIASPAPNASSAEPAAAAANAMDTSTSSPSSVAAPAPAHPFLPARPGSTQPAKAAAPSQGAGNASEAPRPGTPAPAPGSVPAANAATAVPLAPAPVVAPLPKDDLLSKYEESKQRWAWLALRAARDQHLSLFGKIGTGDIEQLANEIEKETQQQLEEKATGDGKAEELSVVGGDEQLAQVQVGAEVEAEAGLGDGGTDNNNGMGEDGGDVGTNGNDASGGAGPEQHQDELVATATTTTATAIAEEASRDVEMK